MKSNSSFVVLVAKVSQGNNRNVEWQHSDKIKTLFISIWANTHFSSHLFMGNVWYILFELEHISQWVQLICPIQEEENKEEEKEMHAFRK